MKFTYIIGNPPYQDDRKDSDNKTFMPPLYHTFMDAAYTVSDKVMLITPARFLFNAGQTPKEWNEKMLADEHLKVEYYEPDSRSVFPNAEIKGGLAITYHDATRTFEPIQVFTKHPELNSILKKVTDTQGFIPLSSIMYNQLRFNLDELYSEYPEYQNIIGSNGKDRRFRNNIFDKLDVFTENKVNDDDIPVLGVIKNKRVWRYIPRRFVDVGHESLDHWKVIVGAASGAGVFGETISAPLVLKPGEGFTQTYISVGAFETKEEAERVLKYMNTKFLRTMLGVLKTTQHNDIGTWRMIPLQDFTPSSDIDWSAPIPDIDQQLYRKYNLDLTEISFIESHVKPMD